MHEKTLVFHMQNLGRHSELTVFENGYEICVCVRACKLNVGLACIMCPHCNIAITSVYPSEGRPAPHLCAFGASVLV